SRPLIDGIRIRFDELESRIASVIRGFCNEEHSRNLTFHGGDKAVGDYFARLLNSAKGYARSLTIRELKAAEEAIGQRTATRPGPEVAAQQPDDFEPSKDMPI
ncbi:MAG: hypothetical protein ACRC7O_02260, partial [Fimbriiglobus sp.]